MEIFAAQFIGNSAAVLTSLMFWIAVVIGSTLASRPMAVAAVFSALLVVELVAVGKMPDPAFLASKVAVYAIGAVAVIYMARLIKKRTT